MSYLLQKGSGKDLVMLHGYLSSKESFYPQIEYFSKFYKVTAFDFPGMGENEPLDMPYSLDDYADWTERILKELNIQFPHVLAHSFGGRVAVKCLSRGDLFDRAVLCGCAGIIPKRTLKYKLKVKAYRAVKKIAPAYAERKFGSAEYRTLSPVMRESYKKIVNEDLREISALIARPVLFVNGADDTE
ncbi:MAG: alpha/beta hydrolase, partial [Clostridiales bacterium]|nr:alpha/beta hydrolase [Clostridiales bacterium]